MTQRHLCVWLFWLHLAYPNITRERNQNATIILVYFVAFSSYYFNDAYFWKSSLFTSTVWLYALQSRFFYLFKTVSCHPLFSCVVKHVINPLIHFCLLLQAQMRDLAGFVETRQQLLTLKPNHRMNWIGFAVSQHLNSKYAMIL